MIRKWSLLREKFVIWCLIKISVLWCDSSVRSSIDWEEPLCLVKVCWAGFIQLAIERLKVCGESLVISSSDFLIGSLEGAV